MRILRELQELTQGQLAKLTGIPQSTISAIENGRVNTAAMKPIARLGYSEYATVETAWRMRRPD